MPFIMRNHRTVRPLLHCTLVAIALTACQPTFDQRGNLPDQKRVATIEPGVTTKQEVSQILGSPSSVSTFSDRTWYYISRRTEQTAFFQPEVLDQQVVVVGFDEGGVVRDVQRLSLADSRPVDPSTRETPSAGKELGFMEQLLGNLGKFNPAGGALGGLHRSGGATGGNTGNSGY
jgi:outer membrane protein assembly factor BamE (lipoprotein component of BamABCDE complex)